jgi:hypothetical protein
MAGNLGAGGVLMEEDSAARKVGAGGKSLS